MYIYRKSWLHILVFAFLAITRLSAQYDYNDALEKSIWFFDANKCGPEVGINNVFSTWRGPCHTTDGSDAGVDLTGGYHDAGDHVKFGLPQAWSASILGYALYEYPQVFNDAGVKPKLLSTLKHFTDYFLRSHTSGTTFYYHVGDGNADHSYWGPPETQTTPRPSIAATPSAPASDVCGQTAAALALMYLNYSSTDAAYANQCLNAAISIYQLGLDNLGRSSDGGGGSFYRSSSHFDDLGWGGIWLSIATGDNSYLTPIDGWLDISNDYGDNNYDKHWAPAWDDITVLVLLKMHEITGTQKYLTGLTNNLNWFINSCPKTPYGLPWLDNWGVLRYASCEAGVGYLANKKFGFNNYLPLADLTIDYALGSNPRNSSYLTGWGANPPVHPHHRANEPDFYYPHSGNTNGIIGGLVGGPDQNDQYIDDIAVFERSEVGLDYNASFILGLAGKIFTSGGGDILNLSPSVLSYTSAAASQTVSVSSNLAWSVTDDASWITVTPTSGNNNGSISVSVSENSGSTARSGTVTVTGGAIVRTVSVTQSGVFSGQYSLTANTTGSGSVTLSPAGGVYDSGTIVSVQATASTGWVFSGWQGDLSGATNPESVTMNSDKIITAVFVEDTPLPCSNPDPIVLDFVFDGPGEHCWVTIEDIDYVNSWNLSMLLINGVDYTNQWSDSMPPKINGQYVIQYSGSFPWSHFEVKQ